MTLGQTDWYDVVATADPPSLTHRYASEYVSPLDSVVILDGAPGVYYMRRHVQHVLIYLSLPITVVGPDRADKLIGAIIKSAAKEAGLTVSRSAIEMPVESDQQSKGYMFVTLNNPTEAQQFQRAMHDLKFDKRHTFRVVPFTDIDKYENLDETYVEPPKEDWKPRVSYGRSHSCTPALALTSHTRLLFSCGRAGALPSMACRPCWTRSIRLVPWRRRPGRLEQPQRRARGGS